MTWDLNFQSAAELVAAYKSKENHAYDMFTKHPEYDELLRKRAKGAGIDFEQAVNATEAEKILLFSLWEDILSIFKLDQAEQMRNNVAIGLVNNGRFRARVERNEFDVILINFGVFTFLNQCTKYYIASNEPQYVVFCDRKDSSQLTLTDINQFHLELITNYKNLQIPVGPLILLDKQADPLRGDMLYIKELFIVAHELSHILSDHKNVSHEAEYQADHLAFQFTREVMNLKKPILNDKFLLFCLVELFKDMQYLSGKVASESHPFPFNRLNALLNSFYGEELANAVRIMITTGDDSEYSNILSSMPNYNKIPNFEKTID